MKHSLLAWKGHGTENDFVLLPDLDAVLSVSPSMVRALCDRHSGIGADGVLRVVRTDRATEPDVREQASRADFFMDYHNADGSLAEMCGNGIRVFARYLLQAGLISGDAVVATRGGPKAIHFGSGIGSDISVDMGRPTIRTEQPKVTVRGLTGTFAGTALQLPNPHVVVELDDLETLNGLDLASAPEVTPPLPEGQNVEFVVRTGPRRLRMRVHERGVGETRSCGTGICAAAVAVAGPNADDEWTIDVPGGQCRVGWTGAGSVVLTGPAVIVARIELSEAWLADHR